MSESLHIIVPEGPVVDDGPKYPTTAELVAHLEKHKGRVIAISEIRSRPHLRAAIVEQGIDSYVVWTVNVEVALTDTGDCGCGNGSYFSSGFHAMRLQRAMDNFCYRIK